MKARISINRVTSNQEPHSMMKIVIEDETSHIKVCEVYMTLEEYAMAISGLSCSKAFGMSVVDSSQIANLGKKKEVKTVVMSGKRYYDKTAAIAKEIAEFAEDYVADGGWQLWDDGLRTQQNNKDGHQITLYRYV